MGTDKDQGNATRGSLRLAPSCAELEELKAKLPRQFVNFTFYRARPEWRLLEEADKQRCIREHVHAVIAHDFRHNRTRADDPHQQRAAAAAEQAIPCDPAQNAERGPHNQV